MPLAELLLIKKAVKGVVRFFLSKLAALIVKQVSTLIDFILSNIVQSEQDDAENGVITHIRGMGRVCEVTGLPGPQRPVEVD